MFMDGNSGFNNNGEFLAAPAPLTGRDDLKDLFNYDMNPRGVKADETDKVCQIDDMNPRGVKADKVEADGIKADGLDSYGIRSLADLLPEVRLANKLLDASLIDTGSFFFNKIEPKKLYSVVGMTNSGKTWWSLSTAISLAREGKKVGYITTEDTVNDLVSYLDLMDASDEVLERVRVIYVEEVSVLELKNLLGLFDEEAYSIIILDYLRADVLSSHTGDLNHTMGEIFKVIRGQLDKCSISVIATIQANANLYNKNLGEVVNGNIASLFTMIDGGYTTSKRSHAVGLLVKGSGSGGRGVLILKAKRPYYDMVGLVVPYGDIDESVFDIRYGKPVSFSMFEGNGVVSREVAVVSRDTKRAGGMDLFG